MKEFFKNFLDREYKISGIFLLTDGDLGKPTR